MKEKIAAIINQLETPQECWLLIKEARKRAVELQTLQYGAKSPVENELIKVLYAYEELLTAKNHRRTRASRTWQMFARHGILKGAERAVNRETDAMGYKILADMGMGELTFEAVICRYPEAFSQDAVIKSKARLAEMKAKTLTAPCTKVA